MNADHIAAGGNVRILQRKLNFRETARPRVDAKSDVIIPKSEKRVGKFFFKLIFLSKIRFQRKNLFGKQKQKLGH